jgi:DNA-binding LytR/AlgR family response regulator
MASEQAGFDWKAFWDAWGRGMVIAVIAGVFMALIAPFQTNLVPLSVRLTYWVGLMVLGSIWGHAAGAWVFRFRMMADHRWLGGALLALIIGLPYTVVVWAVTGMGFERGPKLAALPYFLGPVMLVSGAMTGIAMLANQSPPQTHAAELGAAPPKFLDRLPLKLRGAEIWAVEAEDHYLRIHTDRGSDLILMRLSDAVGELEGLEGAQTHRSWWVAKSAVIGAKRNDGRAVFTLKNGVEVPVSRTWAKVLRARGWY